jgi:hypothetical protein
LTIFATRRSILVKSSIEISGASSSISPAAASAAAGAAAARRRSGRGGDLRRLVEQVLDHLRVDALHQVAVGADGAAQHGVVDVSPWVSSQANAGVAQEFRARARPRAAAPATA